MLVGKYNLATTSFRDNEPGGGFFGCCVNISNQAGIDKRKQPKNIAQFKGKEEAAERQARDNKQSKGCMFATLEDLGTGRRGKVFPAQVFRLDKAAERRCRMQARTPEQTRVSGRAYFLAKGRLCGTREHIVVNYAPVRQVRS